MAKKLKLSEKTEAELTKLLKEQREELRGLRFSAAGARPKDSTAPAKSRAAIARILTHLHAKTHAVAGTDQASQTEASSV